MQQRLVPAFPHCVNDVGNGLMHLRRNQPGVIDARAQFQPEPRRAGTQPSHHVVISAKRSISGWIEARFVL